MSDLFHLSLIVGAIFGVLWAVGKAGDLGMQLHRERDGWRATQ